MVADSSDFQIGTHVEVTSPVHNMRCLLFPARIVAAFADRTRFTVKYDKVKRKLYRKDTRHNVVRDKVHVALIKPLPQREEGYAGFKVGAVVDPFLAGRWLEGVVTEEQEDARFKVFFQVVRHRFEFEEEELRRHREWIRGDWVPPLREQVRVT